MLVIFFDREDSEKFDSMISHHPLWSSLYELRPNKSLEGTEFTERSFSFVQSGDDDWTKTLSHFVEMGW